MFSTKSASRWPSGERRRLWNITRTAASRAGVTNLDNGAPSVDYTTVNTPPSAGHHPLTNRVCDRSRVNSVVDPAGKYCGVLWVDESILRDGTFSFLKIDGSSVMAETTIPAGTKSSTLHFPRRTEHW